MDKIRTGQIERKQLPFEVKAATSGNGEFAGEFEGYAAGILNIDSVGDMILPGAFSADLPRFLSDGVVCWQHDWMTPIGKPLDAKEDGYGLWSKCRVSDTQPGRDAMTLIRDGVVKKLSIGYRIENYQHVDRSGLLAWMAGAALPAEKSAEIVRQYDEQELDGVYLLSQLKLYEYSPVTIPANENAIITGAKHLSLGGMRFADHSQAVRDVVGEFAQRVKGLYDLRVSEGKRFNPQHIESMNAMTAELKACVDHLDSLCAEMEPVPEDNGRAKTVYAEFLKLQAHALGAA